MIADGRPQQAQIHTVTFELSQKLEPVTQRLFFLCMEAVPLVRDIQDVEAFLSRLDLLYSRPPPLLRDEPVASSSVDKVHAPSPAKVDRTTLDEGANSTEVPLVSQKVRLLCLLAPEFDRIRQGMDCLLVAADEGPTKVDSLQVVLLRLQVGDLADVVTILN